jgi:hypothetical protein
MELQRRRVLENSAATVARPAALALLAGGLQQNIEKSMDGTWYALPACCQSRQGYAHSRGILAPARRNPARRIVPKSNSSVQCERERTSVGADPN